MEEKAIHNGSKYAQIQTYTIHTKYEMKMNDKLILFEQLITPRQTDLNMDMDWINTNEKIYKL